MLHKQSIKDCQCETQENWHILTKMLVCVLVAGTKTFAVKLKI